MGPNELHTTIRHSEGADPGTLGSGPGGAVDGEDLPVPLLSAPLVSICWVMSSFLFGAHQPVGHQTLPGSAEMGPVCL